MDFRRALVFGYSRNTLMFSQEYPGCTAWYNVVWQPKMTIRHHARHPSHALLIWTVTHTRQNYSDLMRPGQKPQTKHFH